jgi:bis(5'-nucleosyl)-tetraphosphatase (symmetrical)
MNKRIIAIGDIQGCYDALRTLLDEVNYDPAKDALWFTGDLVNRGPHSLHVLRFVKSLGSNVVSVLGNHDLHLLAVAAGAQKSKSKDTFDELLSAPDRDELLDWLRHRPLLHRHTQPHLLLAHAGIYPGWDIPDAERLAAEAEAIIRSDLVHEFYLHMYGNHPTHWSEQLSGWERIRFIVNTFTRMRFVSDDGGLELKHKGPLGSQPAGFLPWFVWPLRRRIDTPILIGHWSALGMYSQHGIYALDTGCLWGGALTALIVDEHIRHHSIKCRQIRPLDD